MMHHDKRHKLRVMLTVKLPTLWNVRIPALRARELNSPSIESDLAMRTRARVS